MTPSPLSLLDVSDLICVQILPTDITLLAFHTAMVNMGITAISLCEQSTPPWNREPFSNALARKTYRQIVILAPEFNAFALALTQSVLRLGYMTFVAVDDLEDIPSCERRHMAQAGAAFITPDEVISALSLLQVKACYH